MAVLRLRWGPHQLGMVDKLIPNRFEIGFSKEMVCGVIFGVKYQILASKTKMLGKQLFLGCVWPLWGSDWAPDGRER